MKTCRISVLGLALLTIFLASCRKKEIESLGKSDYLIFGHFYGECGGERCVEIFRLEPGKLSEDDKDQYPPQAGTFYDGNYHELPEAQYNGVKTLPAAFPSQLWNVQERIIGMPDAGDWGGLYVEFKKDYRRQYWLIDQRKENIPAYLHLFVDNINAKIAFINQ